jgi:DNA-binding GntR family transcriptional regulator
MGSMERIEPGPTLRERVYDALERLIIDGDLAPGAHLVETDLAHELGVSRGPVREALQTLSRDGWVELRPRQGAFVRQPSEAEVIEFFQVRALLEGECARLAALHVTASSVARARELLADGWSAVALEEEQALVAANAALHAFITELAGNATLCELTERLRKRSQWYFTPVSVARSRDAWAEHEAVIDAIVDGDADRAAASLRAHIQETQRVYRSLVVAEEPGSTDRMAVDGAPRTEAGASAGVSPLGEV